MGREGKCREGTAWAEQLNGTEAGGVLEGVWGPLERRIQPPNGSLLPVPSGGQSTKVVSFPGKHTTSCTQARTTLTHTHHH